MIHAANIVYNLLMELKDVQTLVARHLLRGQVRICFVPAPYLLQIKVPFCGADTEQVRSVCRGRTRLIPPTGCAYIIIGIKEEKAYRTFMAQDLYIIKQLNLGTLK